MTSLVSRLSPRRRRNRNARAGDPTETRRYSFTSHSPSLSVSGSSFNHLRQSSAADSVIVPQRTLTSAFAPHQSSSASGMKNNLQSQVQLVFILAVAFYAGSSTVFFVPLDERSIHMISMQVSMAASSPIPARAALNRANISVTSWSRRRVTNHPHS